MLYTFLPLTRLGTRLLAFLFPVNCPSRCAAGGAAAATSRRFQRSCFSYDQKRIRVYPRYGHRSVCDRGNCRRLGRLGRLLDLKLPTLAASNFAAEIGGAAARRKLLLLLLLQNCFYCRALPRLLGAFRGRGQTISRGGHCCQHRKEMGGWGGERLRAATRRRGKEEECRRKRYM